MHCTTKKITIALGAILFVAIIAVSPSLAMMGGGSQGSSSGMIGSMNDMMNGQTFKDMMGGQQTTTPPAPTTEQSSETPALVETANHAETLASNHIARNPNIKTGTVMERDDDFMVEILTKDDSVVDHLIVEKSSGTIRSMH